MRRGARIYEIESIRKMADAYAAAGCGDMSPHDRSHYELEAEEYLFSCPRLDIVEDDEELADEVFSRLGDT